MSNPKHTTVSHDTSGQIQTDSNNQSYVEKKYGDEHIRATYVEKSGWGVPAVRIQVRDPTGHLRQGPEIPVEILQNFSGKILELLIANRKSIGKHIFVKEVLNVIFDSTDKHG